MTAYERLDAATTTLVLALNPDAPPRLLYFGAPLTRASDLAALDDVQDAPRRESTPDVAPAPGIFPVAADGFAGAPALSCDLSPLRWRQCVWRREADTLTTTLSAEVLRITLTWRLDATGVLVADAHLENAGLKPLQVDHLASLSAPLPAWAAEIGAFAGDWSREAQPRRFTAPPGAWRQANRTGRTGFQGATFLACEPAAGDFTGRMLAFHLGWSGDHALDVETLADGTRRAMLAAAWPPGEIVLGPGESLAAPTAYAAFSQTGFDGVSRCFHPFIRENISPRARRTPRRVHFNSWEAVYFDFDETRLMTLAQGAADLGAERFVLDDGWFLGRRDDRRALGDWSVDPSRFPRGLDPLIDHVKGLGMDFGLWVEPEMVSPDSALYRAHPDWCLHDDADARPTMRQQLWLDLSRAEVRDHLFDALDALLRAHDIAYLKWDCNRARFPSAGANGIAAHRVIEGVYALLDRLRAAHPQVEIESCASGGARIDLGVLQRADRVWASDTTDAIERLRIQRWTGLLLPPELIGAHVGPSPNHTTGRRLPMMFRARVAMFGHMGLELDPGRVTERDKARLRACIAQYKTHRATLHRGRRHAWTSDDGVACQLSVAHDRAEALALLARTGVASHAVSSPVRIPGLDDARYVVSLLDPWPSLAGRRIAEDSPWRGPRMIDGATLREAGLRLPLSDPETAWLIHFRRL